MATKKKAVKKSAPKKKVAPRGKKVKKIQSFNLTIIGDEIRNPLINIELNGDDTTLVSGLVASYLKDTRMREILGKVSTMIFELERKRIDKELRTFNLN